MRRSFSFSNISRVLSDAMAEIDGSGGGGGGGKINA